MKMSRKVNTSILLTGLIAVVFFSSGVVSAQTPIAFTEALGFTDINTAFGTAIRWGVFFAVLVAGLYLVWAGFKYVTAGDDATLAEKARTQIGNAVVGVIITASVYLLLKIMTMIIPGLSCILTI